MPKKKNPDSLESLQNELEKAERKKKYYEQQEKILTRKVIPKLTRAERTNRLCTRAGMLESFLVHPELLSNDQVMDLLKVAFRQKEVHLQFCAEKEAGVLCQEASGSLQPEGNDQGRQRHLCGCQGQALSPADRAVQ